jgi:hypothetical protein
MIPTSTPLTAENYTDTVLTFRDRQAGVSEIYDPHLNEYTYNAYCMEKKLIKELWTVEFDYLEDALKRVNEEFGSWETESFDRKGCGSCVAKK